jgi:hypothetical protein
MLEPKFDPEMVIVLPECLTTDGTIAIMVGSLYENELVNELTRLPTVAIIVLEIPVPEDGRRMREE